MTAVAPTIKSFQPLRNRDDAKSSVKKRRYLWKRVGSLVNLQWDPGKGDDRSNWARNDIKRLLKLDGWRLLKPFWLKGGLP